MSHLLAENTYLNVREDLTKRSTILVPIGAVEQHGSYLPLATDALTAEAVAHDCAERIGVLVAPTVSYGWSPHHMEGEGTVTLRADTLAAVVEDISASLAHHGFERIVVLNGNRVANLPPLQIGAARATASTSATVVVADIALLARDLYTQWIVTEERGPMGHGDSYETSHMLHCRPDLVDLDQVGPAGAPPSQHRTFKGMSPYGTSSRAGWWPMEAEDPAAHPVLVDADWSDAEVGRVLHETLVGELADLIAEFEASETYPPKLGTLI
jgi:creatinine amidohydrolase